LDDIELGIMKKSIPLAVRKTLEKNGALNRSLFKAIYDSNSLTHLVDIDEESEFHFIIKKFLGNGNFGVIYAPVSEVNIGQVSIEVNIDLLNKHLSNWIYLLTQYNKPSTFFDDPILQTYYDDLAPQFDIIEEGAEVKPFNFEQQKRLLQFLERTETIVSNEIDEQEAQPILILIQETKTTMSNSPKKKVIEKIRKIMARAFKAGLQVGEKLLIDFTAELAKKLLTSP